MRVIAGVHRSRPLATFRGDEIRPTADRVKESLFNILRNKVVGGGIWICSRGRAASASRPFPSGRRRSFLSTSAGKALRS